MRIRNALNKLKLHVKRVAAVTKLLQRDASILNKVPGDMSVSLMFGYKRNRYILSHNATHQKILKDNIQKSQSINDVIWKAGHRYTMSIR